MRLRGSWRLGARLPASVGARTDATVLQRMGWVAIAERITRGRPVWGVQRNGRLAGALKCPCVRGIDLSGDSAGDPVERLAAEGEQDENALLARRRGVLGVEGGDPGVPVFRQGSGLCAVSAWGLGDPTRRSRVDRSMVLRDMMISGDRCRGTSWAHHSRRRSRRQLCQERAMFVFGRAAMNAVASGDCER